MLPGTVLVAMLSCGGAARTSEGGAAAPRDPLLGAWRSPTTHEGEALPCPLELEFFADGTVESNLLSDDSNEAACSFARLRFERDERARPRRLEMGGQLSHCIYAIDGDFLQLACEDVGEAPVDFDGAIILQRTRVRELHGIRAIAGSWRGAAHWGPAPGVEIGEDGSFTLRETACRARTDGRGRLLLRCGGREERCLYRATARRLTLRCKAGAYPASFAEGGERAMIETLVLVRTR